MRQVGERSGDRPGDEQARERHDDQHPAADQGEEQPVVPHLVVDPRRRGVTRTAPTTVLPDSIGTAENHTSPPSSAEERLPADLVAVEGAGDLRRAELVAVVCRLRPGFGARDEATGRVDDHDPVVGLVEVVGQERLQLGRPAVFGWRLELLLGSYGERHRVLMDGLLQSAMLRACVREPERHLEPDEHEHRDRQVAEQQTATQPACLSVRADGSRPRGRSRSSPGRRASCAATRRARRGSWSARTSAGPRPISRIWPRLKTAPGSSASSASRSNSFGVSGDRAPLDRHLVGAGIDREVADLRPGRSRPCGRRSGG